MTAKTLLEDPLGLIRADLRTAESAEPLMSSSDDKFNGFAADRGDDQSVAGGVSGGVIGVGEAVVGSVGDHIDPSRLPPAQRQLFMRIQQKQQRDENISELTAKRACIFRSASFYLFYF